MTNDQLPFAFFEVLKLSIEDGYNDGLRMPERKIVFKGDPGFIVVVVGKARLSGKILRLSGTYPVKVLRKNEAAEVHTSIEKLYRGLQFAALSTLIRI